MRYALIGGTGQLGGYLADVLTAAGHVPVIGSRRTDPPLDVTVADVLHRWLDRCDPDVTVYLAAMTDLEECERNPDRARAVHVTGPTAAVRWSTGHDRPMLLVSTDGVFNGERGMYAEDDDPDPLNTYAATKLAGEERVLEGGGLVVRTNFLGCAPRSLLSVLVRRLTAGESVTGFTDAVITPLHPTDLSSTLVHLIGERATGLLHVAGRTPVSKFEIATFVREYLGRGAVVPGLIPQIDVVRPTNISLSAERARRQFGIVDRGWSRGVIDAVIEEQSHLP